MICFRRFRKMSQQPGTTHSSVDRLLPTLGQSGRPPDVAAVSERCPRPPAAVRCSVHSAAACQLLAGRCDRCQEGSRLRAATGSRDIRGQRSANRTRRDRSELAALDGVRGAACAHLAEPGRTAGAHAPAGGSGSSCAWLCREGCASSSALMQSAEMCFRVALSSPHAIGQS